jgi:hypothetical protein
VHQQHQPLWILIVGHAVFGLLLGLAACLAILACGKESFHLLDSVRDTATALTLVLSVSSLTAAGSGISGFILISIERG